MKWQSLLQAHRPDCQALISDDSKLCFLAGLPLSIQVYSTRTNLLVSSLPLSDPQNRKSKLIRILRHPSAPKQLIILVSSTGSIYICDFLNNSLHSTYNTNLLISHAELRNPINSSSSQPSLTIFLATTKLPQPPTKHQSTHKNPPRKSKNRLQTIIYAIKLDHPTSPLEIQDNLQHPEQSIQKRTLLKVNPISAFTSSPCGNWLGVVTGLNIWLIRLRAIDLFDKSENKKSSIESVHLSAPERITSIAFPPKVHADHASSNPNELSIVPCDFFATGSVSGKIALWHALSEAQWSRFVELTARNPAAASPCPTSVSHWHSHAVADLTFTRTGSHLLSGGEEAVLVLWSLDDFSGIGIDSKTFLPRLGTQISSISLIETLDEFNQPGALVTGQDGVIMIVNVSSMSLSRTLKLPGMFQLPSVYKSSTDPILLPIASESDQVDQKPYGNVLLHSSHPCGLQILDGGTGNVLDEILVRPKNIVSRRGARPIVEPKLLFVALGGIDDRYLGTIDSWVDEERGYTPEITLKLWEREHGNSYGFQVIARIDNPHDDIQISSLKLTAELVPKLITTSIDGTIKVWTSSSSSNNNLHLVPNAVTSATTSLGKIKKSSQEVFESLKSIKLKFKNYGILQSRISKDNSILILLHRHPNQNIISIWDLIHFKLLNNFILDSPSIKLNSLRNLSNNNDNGKNLKLKRFQAHDLDFLGDKNQFILVLGNVGCGLFDLLTGSEIGFWNCKPRFMIKTTDETKVVIIHEKRVSEKKKCEEKENSKKEDKKAKLSKITMMAIIDVTEKKTIMNHKIQEVIAGRFIPTRRNHQNSTSSTEAGHSSGVLTKEEILDGLVLVTKSAGLVRAGSQIKEDDYYSINNRTREIEQQVGISSGLPFQEIFNNNPIGNLNGTQQDFDQHRQSFNQHDDHRLDSELDSFINVSPHLIPPTRLIWSKLIQPQKSRRITQSLDDSKNGLLITQQQMIDGEDPNDHSDQLPATREKPNRSSNLTTLDDPANLKPQPKIIAHIAEFNRALLTNLHNLKLDPFQLQQSN